MKPKKHLGQNFLTSKKAVFEIIKAGDIQKDDFILEIGGGKGFLTEDLLKTTAKILVVEKDKELFLFLKQKFEEFIKNGKLILINEDILLFDIKKTLKENNIKNYKIIANIPYYITGKILQNFLSIKEKPSKMILLLQKEVANRIVAKDEKESILSLIISFYGEAKIIYKVSAGSFFPKPKVDSAVLQININNKNIDKDIEDLYIKLIKAAFSHKRKKMISNLKQEFPKIDFIKIFTALNININARSEDLKKDIFIKMIDFLKI